MINTEYLKEEEAIVPLNKILMIMEMYYLYKSISSKNKENLIDDECFVYFFLNICNEYKIHQYKIIAIMLEKKSLRMPIIKNNNSTISKILSIVQNEYKKNKKEINDFIDENNVEEYIKYLVNVDSNSVLLKFIESIYNKIFDRLQLNKKVDCYKEISNKIQMELDNKKEVNENIIIFLHYINFFLHKKIKLPIPKKYNIEEITRNIFNKQNIQNIKSSSNERIIYEEKFANEFILNLLKKQSVDIKKIELSKKIIDTYISLISSLPFTANLWFMNKLNLNFYEILALMQTYDKRINEWNFNEFISEPLYILQSLLNNKKEEMSMDDKLICNILNILFFKKEPEYDIDISKLKLNLCKIYINENNKNLEEYMNFIKNKEKSLKYFYFFIFVLLFLFIFFIFLVTKILYNKKLITYFLCFICFLLLIYIIYKNFKNLLHSYHLGRNQLFYE